MTDLFKYKGEEVKTNYKPGKIYMLSIMVFGNDEVLVYSPHHITYKNLEDFLTVWERV